MFAKKNQKINFNKTIEKVTNKYFNKQKENLKRIKKEKLKKNNI